MEGKKFKYGTKEYWKDWYWNKGGREKVQAKRYIREYERDRQKRRACTSDDQRSGAKVSRKVAGLSPVVSTINIVN